MTRGGRTSKVASRHGEAELEANARTARIDAATLSLRIDLSDQMRIGPGKIELLEAIRTYRSISAAARAINMSYRRAWMLVDDIDTVFGTRTVDRVLGSREGGNARLTSLGLAIVECYRAVERAAAEAARPHLAALQADVERYKDNLNCPKLQS